MLRSLGWSIVGRLTIILIAGGFLTLGAQQQPTAERLQAATQRALINQYCVTCHNDKLKTGGLVPGPESTRY